MIEIVGFALIAYVLLLLDASSGFLVHSCSCSFSAAKEIQVNDTTISFAVAEADDLPRLPVLQTGMFLTGLDSAGEPFFLRIVEDVQVLQGGFVLQAGTLPASVEDAYDKLTVDGFFSAAEDESTGLSLLSDEPKKSNLEFTGKVLLRANVEGQLGLRLKPTVKLSIRKLFRTGEFSLDFSLLWSYGYRIAVEASEEFSVKQAVNIPIPKKVQLRIPLLGEPK